LKVSQAAISRTIWSNGTICLLANERGMFIRID
jgi:hypothetical protein